MAAMAMLHQKDPKEVILEALGDVPESIVLNNEVLCAVYERPEQTKSGIYLTDKNRDEDKYQGKVGLVVKLGPKAFVDDDKWSFAYKAQVGDWVWFRPSDGQALTVNGKLCRAVSDTNIRGQIPHPDMVW
jgi:co-chaperonin GroES (HSP10)